MYFNEYWDTFEECLRANCSSRYDNVSIDPRSTLKEIGMPRKSFDRLIDFLSSEADDAYIDVVFDPNLAVGDVYEKFHVAMVTREAHQD